MFFDNKYLWVAFFTFYTQLSYVGIKISFEFSAIFLWTFFLVREIREKFRWMFFFLCPPFSEGRRAGTGAACQPGNILRNKLFCTNFFKNFVQLPPKCNQQKWQQELRHSTPCSRYRVIWNKMMSNDFFWLFFTRPPVIKVVSIYKSDSKNDMSFPFKDPGLSPGTPAPASRWCRASPRRTSPPRRRTWSPAPACFKFKFSLNYFLWELGTNGNVTEK